MRAKCKTDNDNGARVEKSVSVKEMIDTMMSTEHCYSTASITGHHRATPWPIHSMNFNVESMNSMERGDFLIPNIPSLPQCTILSHSGFLAKPHHEVSAKWMQIGNVNGEMILFYCNWKEGLTRKAILEHSTKNASDEREFMSQDIYYIVLKYGDVLYVK
jgi:hypothetical protein